MFPSNARRGTPAARANGALLLPPSLSYLGRADLDEGPSPLSHDRLCNGHRALYDGLVEDVPLRELPVRRHL